MKHILALALAVALAVPATARGSEPVPPPTEDEVVFASGDRTLVGTITLPGGEPPFPAVVLVHGSGPLTRDQDLLGFAMFRDLADALANAGVASLRYDKRGVGASTGDYGSATSADFADDAEAALSFLRTRPDLRHDALGLIGHSEGGFIVPMVAARDEAVAALVLLAPAVAPAFDDLLHQQEGILRAGGLPEAVVAGEVERVRTVLELTRAEAWDELEATLRAMIDEQVAGLPPAQVEAMGGIDAIVAANVQQYRVWYHFLLQHDATLDLEQVRAPVLALFGELDVLVDSDRHRPVLEAALRRAIVDDVDVRTVSGVNHHFQVAVTGGPHEYQTLEPAFAPDVLDAVVGWLAERLGR